MIFTLLSWFLACSSEPPRSREPDNVQTNSAKVISQPPKPVENLDKGQQHPPLPADNPAWEWDAKGFVPDFGWYGEHNWDDVRMRVVGHLAMSYREKARTCVLLDGLQCGLEVYNEMARTLRGIDTKSSTNAEEIRQILIQSAERDAQIITALMGSGEFPQTSPDTIIHWRIEFWKLLNVENPTKDQFSELQGKLTSLIQRTPTPKIDGFKNFTDRHKLRKTLFKAYVDTLDPLLPSDHRWGYWQPSEMNRQAIALWNALESLKKDSGVAPTPDWWSFNPVSNRFTTTLNTLDNPIYLPSLHSASIPDLQPDWSPKELGRLPTGDSIIDVAGQPGPMGIGSLMKLDVDDSEHRQWLTSQGESLSKLTEQPIRIVEQCRQAIAYLNSFNHGSRFYNVKQFRNACTRQLARLGYYSAALELFQESFPLHHQDWACPNREGLLLMIIGRLEVLSGNHQQGSATLERSIQSSLDFLELVDKAERREITSPKPPMMKMKGPPTVEVQRPHSPHKKQNGTPQQNPTPPSP